MLQNTSGMDELFLHNVRLNIKMKINKQHLISPIKLKNIQKTKSEIRNSYKIKTKLEHQFLRDGQMNSFSFKIVKTFCQQYLCAQWGQNTA